MTPEEREMLAEMPAVQELVVEVDSLRAAIRTHRNQRGDDRCWMDDEELYRALPEGYTPPVRDVAVELTLCEKFIACRRNPATEYVSPQREIERLEADVAKLRKEVQKLVAEAVAAEREACARVAAVR